MRAFEIRDLDSVEIVTKLEAARKEMFNLRLSFYDGSLEDPNQISRLRKEVARMLTILRERELAAEYVASQPATEPGETAPSKPARKPRKAASEPAAPVTEVKDEEAAADAE